jgi:hypothetical protein
MKQNKPRSENIDIERVILDISPELVVMNGVFKGMKYPKLKSIGSSLAPKILGSYEREIQPVLKKGA